MSSGAVARAARRQSASPEGLEQGRAAVASTPTSAGGPEATGTAGPSRPASKALVGRCSNAAAEEQGGAAASKAPGARAKSPTRHASSASEIRDIGKGGAVAAVPGVPRARRTTVDGASINHSISPTECTLSTASWRHNPYGVPPPSPMTDSASTTHHQSPRLSLRSRADSTIVNDVADYSIANEDTADFPSIKVCTRSCISSIGNGTTGRRRSCCVTTLDASGRQLSFGEGGGRCEAEENMYGPRSPATSWGDDPLIELQQHPPCPYHHHHHHHPHRRVPSCSQTYLSNSRQQGLRRSRANSVQSCRRISGLRHTSDAHVLPSLSTSFSSLQLNHYYHDVHQPSHNSDAHRRTYSLQSAVSSPMMNVSFSGVHDLLGLSHSPIGHNVISPEESAASRPPCSCEAESLASHRSTTEHFFSPMPLSGDFFTRRSSSHQHGTGGTNGNSFGMWSLVQVRPSSPQAAANMEGYDADTTDSRGMRLDDDERELEEYNTTLRPNEVNASAEPMGFDGMGMGPQGEEQRIVSSSPGAASAKSASVAPGPSEEPCDFSTTLAFKKTPQGTTMPAQEPQQAANAQQPIDWSLLEHMMMQDPMTEVMCPSSCTFSVYDAEIENHYSIESTEIVATRGSVEYLKMNEARGSQSRFRFQLCKRYLNKRCTRGANCQYIHTHSVPPPTSVHVNENIISAAVVEGLEMPPEVLRGGNNKHGYPTMPPGVMFRVFPPNQGKSIPQLIPSEMILRTAGASNVYTVFAHSGTGKARDVPAAEAADTSGSENGNLSNVKARHCAHFQFNKMCNLGESCNFIHSLVPYVQRLSMSTQGPRYNNSMMTPHSFVMPSTSMAQFGQFPNGNNGGGVAPSYPMEFMHHSLLHISPSAAPPPPAAQQQQKRQHEQQQQHVMPPPAMPHLIHPPQAADHLLYHRNMSMMPLPMYMSSPVTSTWDGVQYGANYH